MHRSIHGRTRACVAAAALIVAVFAAPARGAYTITVIESGGNVVASGSGSFNLTGMSPELSGNARGFVEASTGALYVGPTALTPAIPYSPAAGPANFGAGVLHLANAGSGSIAGIDGTAIIVPANYASGTSLSGTATWTGATFATLGVTPGTYTWGWGSGANADTLTLQIGAAAPAVARDVPAVSDVGLTILCSLLGLFAAAAIRRGRS